MIKFCDEDDAYDYFRQREIDDEAEAQRALFAGKEAGRVGLNADANPHQPGTAQYDAWERGRNETAKVAA